MTLIEPPKFPAGLHLLSRWQSGDPDAKNDLNTIFDAAIAGHYDADFAVPELDPISLDTELA